MWTFWVGRTVYCEQRKFAVTGRPGFKPPWQRASTLLKFLFRITLNPCVEMMSFWGKRIQDHQKTSTKGHFTLKLGSIWFKSKSVVRVLVTNNRGVKPHFWGCISLLHTGVHPSFYPNLKCVFTCKTPTVQKSCFLGHREYLERFSFLQNDPQYFSCLHRWSFSLLLLIFHT